MSTTTTDATNHLFPPPGTDPAGEVTIRRDTYLVERHGHQPGGLSVTPTLPGVAGQDPAVCPEFAGWVSQYMAAALFLTATAAGVEDVSVSRNPGGRWSVHLRCVDGAMVSAQEAARYVALLDPVRNPDSGHVVVDIHDHYSRVSNASVTSWGVLLDLGADDNGHQLRVEVVVFGGLRPAHPDWLPDVDTDVTASTGTVVCDDSGPLDSSLTDSSLTDSSSTDSTVGGAL